MPVKAPKSKPAAKTGNGQSAAARPNPWAVAQQQLKKVTDLLEDVVKSIKDLAGSGAVGAGMVFISPVEDAIRLSTRESGKSAIV